MKKLLMIILMGFGSFALASWQEWSLQKLRAEIDRLLAEVEQSHQSLRESHHSLVTLRRELQTWRARLELGTEFHNAVPFMAPPGPEVEGWWPAHQPYFYLDKQLLPLVRLNDLDRTPEEVRAAGEEFHPNQDYSIENRLFSGNHLNEQMVKLLGMTEIERASVERIYDDLRREVQVLESLHIQKVDPPEPVDHSRVIVARLPSLAPEVEPLLERTRLALHTILGPTRTALLSQQAEQFFNRYRDGLGSTSREFLRYDNMLSVYYIDVRGHRSAKNISYSCGQRDSWEYSHLFGPGSPGEFK